MLAQSLRLIVDQVGILQWRVPVPPKQHAIALHADHTIAANREQQRAVVIGAINAAAERAIAVKYIVSRMAKTVAIARCHEHDVRVNLLDKLQRRGGTASVMRYQQDL